MAQGNDAIEALLALFGEAELEARCQALFQRFRAALKVANPDLTEAQMAAYDATFTAGLEPLKAAFGVARREAAAAAISEEEAAFLARLAASGDLATLAGVVKKLGPALAGARNDVFQSQGVEIHRQSAEAAFEVADGAL